MPRAVALPPPRVPVAGGDVEVGGVVEGDLSRCDERGGGDGAGGGDSGDDGDAAHVGWRRRLRGCWE